MITAGFINSICYRYTGVFDYIIDFVLCTHFETFASSCEKKLCFYKFLYQIRDNKARNFKYNVNRFANLFLLKIFDEFGVFRV